MGRYAYFNTGYEYKFSFAVQPSTDILKFSGTIITLKDNYNDYNIDVLEFVNSLDSNSINYDEDQNYIYGIHKWTREDKDKILNILSSFGEDFIMPDFSKYDLKLDGTTEMYCKEPFRTVYNCNHQEISKFTLGCVIYHQLLYKEELIAKYDFT